MIQDLRFGLKLLWKEKGFTITALATLALCIGANTAIFTVLHAVILAPLPFDHPEQLVTVGNIYPGAGISKSVQSSIPDYLDRRKMTDILDSVALRTGAGYDVGSDGAPARIEGEQVTPSYFQVLRAAPLMGRTFIESDAVFRHNQYVILSYGLWRDMFGRDPHVLEKDLRLSGSPCRIVGVMPEGFASPGSKAKFWVPLTWAPQQEDARHSNSWDMIVRLKPGVSIATVQQHIDALNRYNTEHSKLRKLLENARFSSVIHSAKDDLTADVRPMLVLLECAVAFVLLIGCVNVANLMLVRSNVRMKELAIRHSLGAGRTRLAVQLLIESLALALLGGAFGVGTGLAGVRVLSLLGADALPRGETIQMNPTVLLFSAGIAVLTGLIFGSAPVYHLVRQDLNAVFRSNERTGTSEKRALWTRSALVVCQVSLAFVLLIGAGLLTLSFTRLLNVNPGFATENVLSAEFSLPRPRYNDDARVRQFEGRVIESLHTIPGVTASGLSGNLPFTTNHSNGVVQAEGYQLASGELPPVPFWNMVDGGYFAAMKIPLLEGRVFTQSDTADAPKVTVIDEYLAKKYWPGRSAVGGQIRRGPNADSTLFTVIGVVGNVQSMDLGDKSKMGMCYFDYRQDIARNVYVVARTAANDTHAIAAVRDVLRQADPELALFDVKSMPERISTSLRDRRAAMAICLAFAGLALALSAIGIYGVLAYTVT
ncbi:MAG TPA: ABC transporter permease, partial [Candidatus Solibacter sp.]|nr:ABC transporter permease [Candidatus Solibacter sp.]